jgi:hypothetical protein
MNRWLPSGREVIRAGNGEKFIAPHYFMTCCEYCGWTGSSELAQLIHYDDDAATSCPACDRTFSCDEINARLGWVIVGGESGHHARPMHPDWVRSLRDQCAAAGVPFLFKQWGEWLPDTYPVAHMHMTEKSMFVNIDGTTNYGIGNAGCAVVNKVGKHNAGRIIDGRTHDGFPK